MISAVYSQTTSNGGSSDSGPAHNPIGSRRILQSLISPESQPRVKDDQTRIQTHEHILRTLYVLQSYGNGNVQRRVFRRSSTASACKIREGSLLLCPRTRKRRAVR